MNETAFTKKIIHFLRQQGVWVRKLHGNQYQCAGLPDLLCLVKGHALFLEVKVGSNKTTAKQDYEIAAIRSAGASAAVVRTMEDVEHALKQARLQAGA